MDTTTVGTTQGIIITLLLMIVMGGLIGALARALMPGPNPMSIGMTILLGIGGSFVGGLIARLLSKHPGLTPFQVKTVLHALASNAR